MKRFTSAAVILGAVLGVSATAQAAIITTTLGNGAPGFSDGDTPAVFQVGGAQSGQPAPFDQGYGTDGLFGGNFSQSWTFNYGAIADTILSAELTIGIYDHDSAASGSQLASYTLDGIALTSALDPLFEGGGGGDLEYNVYTLALGASFFTDLADGSATVSLALQGPGLVFALFPLPGALQETGTNGANLIFSTLTITTQDRGGPGPGPVPEPGSLALLGLGLGALAWRRRQSTAERERDSD